MSNPEKIDAGGRRAQIIKCALNVVARTGLKNLTMKKVAAEVGVSEPALYRYFPSKDDLILALIQNYRENIVDPARELASREDWSPSRRLGTIWLRNLDFHLAMKGHPSINLGVLTPEQFDGPFSEVRDLVRGHHAVLTDLIAQLKPEELEVRARELALLLVGINMAASIWGPLLGDSEEVLRRTKEELVPFLIRCLEGKGFQKSSAAG